MIKNIMVALLLSTTLIGLSSCLKESRENIDPNKGTPNVVEFANTGDDVSSTSVSTYPRFNTDLGSVAAGATVEFNVNLSYSGVGYAPQDINITLAVDEEALTLFNSQNGTNYETPAAEVFTMPMTATIKKGEKKAQVKVAITNNASFDFNKSYALPLKIASASAGTISGNFGKAIYSFSARNEYDGAYTMDATADMIDLLSPALTGYYPEPVELRTFDGSSVALYDAEELGTYGHVISSSGSLSYYGAFSPVFYIDKANGTISKVENYYGPDAGGNKRNAMIDPAGTNKVTFDANGHISTIEVSYIMTQSVTTPNAPRTYFHEKFTYTGSR